MLQNVAREAFAKGYQAKEDEYQQSLHVDQVHKEDDSNQHQDADQAVIHHG
jgi:hypothetical protein